MPSFLVGLTTATACYMEWGIFSFFGWIRCCALLHDWFSGSGGTTRSLVTSVTSCIGSLFVSGSITNCASWYITVFAAKLLHIYRKCCQRWRVFLVSTVIGRLHGVISTYLGQKLLHLVLAASRLQVPTLWNSLPVNIRNANSLPLFKKLLKTFLFIKAYGA